MARMGNVSKLVMPPLPHESFRVALEYGNVSKLVMPLLFKVKLLKINK